MMLHNSKPSLALRHRPSPLSNQRGIAAILIVVLIGIAITATSFGVMHSMRSTQEKQVAVHAATHAQTGVWAGVEAFRRYLEAENPDNLPDLSGNYAIDLQGYGNMTVQDVQVTPIANGYRVEAQVVNVHDAARSSAAVGVVYELTLPDNCPGCVKLNAALDFHDNLTVGGGIEFVTPEGTLPVINVDGNVEMLNLGISQLGILNSTGTVRLDSQVRIEEINSNGDVTLTGSAFADKVSTRGRFTSGGGAGAGIVWANGAVIIGGSARSNYVNTRSTADISMGMHGNFNAASTVTVRNDAVRVDRVETKGNVVITPAGAHVDVIIGEGNLTCPTGSWDKYTSISLNGILNPGCTAVGLGIGTNVVVGANNQISIMAPVPEVIIPQLLIDVWTLKDRANYVVEWDSAKGRTKVTVKNINGVPNGVYWVGDYSDNQRDYLCTAFNGTSSTSKCTAPVTPGVAMCLGHSIWNNCLSYNTGTKTWEFNGTSAVPGVLWFDGNVHLDNGYNYNTILATGNVKTGGQFRGVSVNYGAYAEACAMTGAQLSADLRTIYHNRYKNHYPTNFCNTSTNTFIPNDVGNIGIAAGGYNPAGGGAYSGGNISLGASNRIYGMVLAGNYLDTGGETRIFGFVSAAVQGGKGAKDNILSGSTVIDLTHHNEYYQPNIAPDMSGGACPRCAPPPSAPAGAKLLWSRYL